MTSLLIRNGSKAMGKRECIVCRKKVRDGDETEHLRSNHLGPHYFWVDAKKYRTMEPSMTVAEIKRMASCSPGYQFFQERDLEPDLGVGDAQSVDLTREPHFFAVPPATMFG